MTELFVLDCDSDADSYFLDPENIIAKFLGVIIENNKIFVLYQPVQQQFSDFILPFDSAKLNIYNSDGLLKKETKKIHYLKISLKLFKLTKSNSAHKFIYIPLQHTNNI